MPLMTWIVCVGRVMRSALCVQDDAKIRGMQDVLDESASSGLRRTEREGMRV